MGGAERVEGAVRRADDLALAFFAAFSGGDAVTEGWTMALFAGFAHNAVKLVRAGCEGKVGKNQTPILHLRQGYGGQANEALNG